MAEPRIIAVELDERTIIRRSEVVEREREVAVTDLLAENHFAPVTAYPGGYAGPFRVMLRVADGRLAIDIAAEDGTALETITLGLTRFRKLVRDYFAIVDSYYRALGQATAQAIEPIDMARRGIHNEAAETLQECLAGKVDVDFDTARRLFTLICVLHIKA
ncbi:UPF0262 family protein [Sphingomonas sp. ID0503]|uniref:UPF0262 family protein n=1 Tax=Sphingomonas sp. ID0503 TaxID=3399691 RepID=UPI003AFA4D1C